ncbi:DAK2 domain-containing protein [Acaricomes phytoseiuli]|nr:DAK2 domain-containing protein [Acaricomes phytoseiuli]MCW1249600.1 DAK2 domain-containing protein [Acaricomes phytoseiuli]
MRRWLMRCEEALANHSDRLNAINIFPVADGDTGTNLYATVRSANHGLQQRAELVEAGDLGAVLDAAAQAAMEQARGNSGTLFSVFLAALAEPLHGAQRLNAPLLAAALQRAQIRSWSALSEPRPGTMLSVMQAAAEGAAMADATVAGDESNQALSTALENTVEVAYRAVIATESQLDELRRARVVDSGGVGLLLVLDCLRAEILHQSVRDELFEELVGYDSGHGQLTAPDHGMDGVEVMCTIVLTPLEAASLRMRLDELGNSVIMSPVGQIEESSGGYRWRVHVHVTDPAPALAVIKELSEPLSIEIKDLRSDDVVRQDDD